MKTNHFEHHDKLVRKSLGKIFWSTPVFLFFSYIAFAEIRASGGMKDGAFSDYMYLLIMPSVFGSTMIRNIWIFNKEKKERDSQPPLTPNMGKRKKG